MATLEGCRCRGASGRNNNSSSSSSILYSILKSDDRLVTAEEQQQHPQQHTLQHLFQKPPSSSASASLQEVRQQACSCGSTRRRGVLRSPQVTCKAASAVLVKTLRFVKNVPCFRELPEDDQLVLIRSGWAPLLVLGLAQDRVDFETTETVEPSMLQRILTGCPDRQSEAVGGQNRGAPGVSVVDIEAIKAFLKKCWSVDISTKEYAYLKGAVLFNPDLEGLRCLHYIQSLRREAHQALNEHVRLIHREDTTRFAKLLIALSMLRAISPPVVAQLFFRPVIGTVNIEEVLMEMFYGK
ncbi:nuclear receptor subfamily 0 group B member 1 [Oreochromis niloticus]|uniref:Orphan nuclear receptor DAX1 n=4 Tax=Oreochromis TaxID=8139 RepID=Q8AY13_ORENI|nr:nuclear receptor subfamily 0 group B member 1 [Oreochromis niloticus]XP_031590559.2 nuclear receptor subfamily 0 group B member 1 [Oreochromis aureus]AAN17672.1 orphan nuclear receptor Dax-1 [Oreochromis niloticus]ABB88833.1 orphan nuclear receptor DAX1 [Oreochromis niloticus]